MTNRESELNEKIDRLAAEYASLLLSHGKMKRDLRECRKVASELRENMRVFKPTGKTVCITTEWLDRIISTLEGSGA